MSKVLRGFDLLAYMFVRANAKDWTEALSFTPNRKLVMEELRKDLPALDKLIPNDQEFLNYLNAAIPKSLILKIHKEVEGQDTKYDYKLIKNIIHNMLKGGKQ
tara:strand:+ start:532 stop:840 length:309 start_codon:yes stop_codon:yes gene_type:complete